MDERAWDLTILPLKFTWQPTTDELNYLRQLVSLRIQRQQAIETEQYDSSRPSMIVDQFLFQGDVKHASNEGLLEELNIQSIVNMSDCQLDPTIVNQRHVLWINIEDDVYTDIDQYFETTNKFLRSCQADQKNVLVHCQMGVSRSSAIVLAYLMKYYQYSLAEAYDYLIQRRPIVEPNIGFLLQLIRYEQTLRTIDSVRQESTITTNKDSKFIELQTTTKSRNSWQFFNKLCCFR